MPPKPPDCLALFEFVAFRQESESLETYLLLIDGSVASWIITYTLREVNVDSMIIN